MVNWETCGELTVGNSWQFFPHNVISDTFKITTTIVNQGDWDKWKFRSAAYLRFYYADGSASISYYIKVISTPTIYSLPVPTNLRQQGYIIRTPAIIRASRYLPLTPNANFADWSFKLEALSGSSIDFESVLSRIESKINAINQVLGD